MGYWYRTRQHWALNHDPFPKSKNKMILRVQHPTGQARVEINPTDSCFLLLEKVSKLAQIPLESLVVDKQGLKPDLQVGKVWRYSTPINLIFSRHGDIIKVASNTPIQRPVTPPRPVSDPLDDQLERSSGKITRKKDPHL
jgi:hypothetical protein